MMLATTNKQQRGTDAACGGHAHSAVRRLASTAHNSQIRRAPASVGRSLSFLLPLTRPRKTGGEATKGLPRLFQFQASHHQFARQRCDGSVSHSSTSSQAHELNDRDRDTKGFRVVRTPFQGAGIVVRG